jgi:hypothetical protein
MQSTSAPVGVQTLQDQDPFSPLEGQVIAGLRCKTVKGFAPFPRKTAILLQREAGKNYEFLFHRVPQSLKNGENKSEGFIGFQAWRLLEMT